MVPPPTDEMVAVYRRVETWMDFSGNKERFCFWAVDWLVGGVKDVGMFFTTPSSRVFVDDKVSVGDGVSGGIKVSGGARVSGGGDTNSIYLGVKINTKEIRKKARRVFLSIFYFTGSLPPRDKGLHFNILKDVR